MVAVANALTDHDADSWLEQIAEGLCESEKTKLHNALLWAEESYEGHFLGTGSPFYRMH
jgi:hypothetical protein